ncbi:hypothetical protein AMECASPLE_029208 [Ameca splendens]|uniref:G-protein coupled receptors family 1 profile domain-containing protein n=1 Tax=Ameca splendens TaxID=208324 RepID=A0ABV0XIW2_9TELE
MGYVYTNTTLFIQNYNQSNNSFTYNVSNKPSEYDDSYYSPFETMFCWYYHYKVQPFTLSIISTWLPLVPLAIYCIYSQATRDHVIPVFIVNLLLADILQIWCMIVNMTWINDYIAQYVIVAHVYNGGVMASVFFITFIAMERYLLIAWPILYRFCQTLKVSASVSAVSWILSIYIGFNNGNWLGALLALPLPLFIFFLVRTFKALSTSHNVPSDEKRQIVAVLTVVVFTYTLTFLPQIFIELWWLGWWWWDFDYTTYINFTSVSCTLIQIRPLTNLLLYILIKKWVFDKLLAFLCCCRNTKDVQQQTNSITTTCN